MALPATDTFTTGSNQSLTDYSASWSNALNVFEVLAATDDVHSNSDLDECGAYWNADAFDDDQYALGIINNIDTTHAIGLSVRASSDNYYGVYTDATEDYLFEVIGGAWNQLGINENQAVATDEVYLEVNGGNLTFKINSVTELGPTSDDSLTSGSAGLSGYSNANNRIDDWEGGNLGVATPAVSESDDLTIGESIGADLSIGVGIEMDGAGYQGTGVRVR